MIDDTLVILVTAAVAWSVVELLNQLPVSMRVLINRALVIDWLEKGMKLSGPRSRNLEKELVDVATGGSRGALYRLESDQLSAQINAGAEIVLDQPERYQELLAALAGVDWRGPGVNLERFFSARSTLPTEGSDPEIMQIRHELTLGIHRRLDDLQIRVRSQQYIANQSQQVVIAVLTTAAFGLGYPRHAVLGVIAGFVSPVIARIIRAVRN